jgi:4-hydroxy-tetrahydrodipicolinate synthase
MTATFPARGVHTAIATPFSADFEIDTAAFDKLVDFQVSEGVTGIVPGGTTGESPTLTWEEQGVLVKHTVARAKGVSVLAGTGSNSTDEAVEASKTARDLGASAVLLVDCYYNGPSSLELRTEYYERVLDGVPDVTVVPYVIPGRTGCVLSAEDLAILHQRYGARVPAVKQATGDYERMRYDRALAGETLAVLSGDDDITLTMMRDDAIRAPGVISVMSNIVPGAMSRMVAAQAKGDAAAADAIAQKLAPLFAMVTCFAKDTRTLPNGRAIEVTDKFRNPVPAKTMMAGLGMLSPVTRAPLGKMTHAAVAMCRDALRKVHETDASLLAPIDAAFGVSVAKRLADDGVWQALGR